MGSMSPSPGLLASSARESLAGLVVASERDATPGVLPTMMDIARHVPASGAGPSASASRARIWCGSFCERVIVPRVAMAVRTWPAVSPASGTGGG
jgi:hypothetical protein